MQKKELTDFKVRIIVMVVLTILVAIAIPLTVKIVNYINTTNQNGNYQPPNNSDDNNDDKPSESLPILSVPESISIDKFTTNQKFEYNVTNLGNYQVTITIENLLVAELDSNNYIIPYKVGSTNIISTINCEPQISKTTTLTIADAVTDFSYCFYDSQQNVANNLFVGRSYTLKITENAIVDSLPNIEYENDYINNFELVSKQDNVYTYSFTTLKTGEIRFCYNSKYCQKEITLTSYNLISEIEVAFSNNVLINDSINLYLFKEQFAEQANADGYFSLCEYAVIIEPDYYNDISISVTGTSIVVNDNTISAIDSGISQITFASKSANISKTFIVNVKNILPTHICINNEIYDIDNEVDLTCEANTEHDFCVTFLPVYTNFTPTIQTSSNVIISNNKLTITSFDDGKVYINCQDELLFTCNIIVPHEYYISVSLNSSTCESSLDNNLLIIKLSEQNFVVLECAIYDKTTNKILENSNLKITIDDTTIINGTNNIIELKNNLLTLAALQSGSTQIMFDNEELKITYSLTIIIT